MRKSTLFVSAALTTFMLAVMFGVASAYQKIVQSGVPTEAAQQQAQPVNAMVGTSSTVAGSVSIEQAADLASSVIGRTDLYAAENAQLDGVDAYLVTFSSGDIVYVSLDGKVLSISKLPVTYIAGQSTWAGGGGNGGNGGGNASVAPAAPSAPVVTGGNDNSSNDNGGDEDHDGGEDGGEDEHDD
ncbi:MAG: hypothetical protein HOP27_05645 [Anaerolineales bacterium]|nr:hypothetical protein [Anaerolineales bacterium]